MIKAKKNKVAIWMFRLVQKRYVRKMFSKMYVKDNRPSIEPGLYIINHSTWWDPLIVCELQFNELLNDAYVMTHMDGMKKVPIFKYIGAYSVDKNDIKHVLESLRYTEKLLKEHKTVCIFPQGEERHQEKRPLDFQQGVAMLARRLRNTPIYPVTLYYTFRHTQKSEVWVEIGEAIHYELNDTREQINKHFEHVITKQLNALKEDVIHNRNEQFKQLL